VGQATEQPSYLCELLQLCRPSRSLRSSNHNLLNIPRPCTAFVQRSFAMHTLPLVSGIHSLIQSPMTFCTFWNPDLKHSCTEGPISNHSVTLIVPVIRLIGWRMACFYICLLAYLWYLFPMWLSSCRGLEFVSSAMRLVHSCRLGSAYSEVNISGRQRVIYFIYILSIIIIIIKNVKIRVTLSWITLQGHFTELLK